MTDSTDSMQHLANLRKDYRLRTLDEHEVPADPIELFKQWIDEAIHFAVSEPTAMTLATIDPDGTPSARIVLLKGVMDGAFSFFTNQRSAKAQAIASHSDVALVWFWPEIERQVRVKGSTTLSTDNDNDGYWSMRPRRSQLGAWASEQSAKLTSRAELEESMTRLTDRFEGVEVSRPPHWGGYLVKPREVEFWQGRESRLHDRVLYSRSGTEWTRSRLAP